MSVDRRRQLIEPDHSGLSIVRQCELISVSRSTFYREPAPETAMNLTLMRLIDEQFLETPWYGSRQMARHLRRLGHAVGRERVRRLMAKMGKAGQRFRRRSRWKGQTRAGSDLSTAEDDCCAPGTPNLPLPSSGDDDPPAEPALVHRHYLHTDASWLSVSGRGDGLGEAAQGSIGEAGGIADEGTRKVLSWRVSNTMDVDFCIEALEEAVDLFGRPEICNSDQGSQFTSPRFTEVLTKAGVRISMDGRGRWMDNVFIERLWRSLKYECVYLHAFETGSELRAGLRWWISYYNSRRPHSGLDGKTPDEAYAATGAGRDDETRLAA
jgi:putative transposase